MRRIGYARVSTKDQVLDLQISALEKAGCDEIFSDHGESGVKRSRPQFDAALAALQEGDVLVVYSLSRAGRSTLHLAQMLEALRARNIGFQSLSEAIDTTTPFGKMAFAMLGALAEFERDVLLERCEAGREAARARGVKFGPKLKSRPKEVDDIRARHAAGVSPTALARELGLSRATIYRRLA